MNLEEKIALVRTVVSHENISVYFQPIVSIEAQGIVGVEAFSRGVDDDGNHIADASILFDSILPFQEQQSIETLCHKRSFTTFKGIDAKFNDMVLFLNVNSMLHNERSFEAINPIDVLKEFDFSPRTIAFEFDVKQLGQSVPVDLIMQLKKQGYRISLDSIQADFRSRELVLGLEADFAKMDRSFYDGIDKSKAVADSVQSAAEGCLRAGVIPMAKGVETEAEAEHLLLAGLGLQQGFFFTHTKSKQRDSFKDKLKRLYACHRNAVKNKFELEQDHFRNYHLLLKNTMYKLEKAEYVDEIDDVLKDVVRKNKGVVSSFVLDASGKQLSHRYIGWAGDPLGRRLEGCAPGADHTYKEYFMYLNSGFEKIAGGIDSSPFCRERCHYLAGCYLKEKRHRGEILVLEYSDKYAE